MMHWRSLIVVVALVGCAGSSEDAATKVPGTSGTEAAVEILMQRDNRRWPGLACADSVRPLLKDKTRAEAFVLNEETRQRDGAKFESYLIRRAVGALRDSDCQHLVALLADSSSYGEYMKPSIPLPDFGVWLLSATDTLAVVLTFDEENCWMFRDGARRYGGHFDPIAVEMRALVTRVAPDADVR